jgi:transcriptional regulator with XRE-family HTH domain
LYRSAYAAASIVAPLFRDVSTFTKKGNQVQRNTNTRLTKALAVVLQSAREQQGLTQEDLAHRAGVHRTYISEIERRLRNFSFSTLIKLADGLEMPLSLFIYLAEYEASRETKSSGGKKGAAKAKEPAARKPGRPRK